MKRVLRSPLTTFALALTLAMAPLASVPAGAQCAMCKTALTQSAEGQRMGQSFNNAILLLLGAPYLIAGTIAASLWYTHYRRKKPPSPSQASLYSP